MYETDFHLHSRNSFDGHDSVDDICAAALVRGRREIAITDHLDIYTKTSFVELLDYSAVLEEIESAREKYQGKLIIRAGVELGQPQVNPADTARFFREYHPDFVIGSVHNMENDLDLYYYDWTDLDEFLIYEHYIDWLMDLAENYDYDVMGHLTYPLRYVFEARGTRFPLERYYDRFRELFRVVIERGKGIECNTSGFRQPIGEALPPLEILKLYRDCGGEIITVGSDAHYKEDVSVTVPKGEQLLLEAGFRYITTFENRRPIFHSIV